MAPQVLKSGQLKSSVTSEKTSSCGGVTRVGFRLISVVLGLQSQFKDSKLAQLDIAYA